MRYSPNKNLEEATIADIYLSRVQNIVLEARWREPENLAKIAKKTVGDDIEGKNLASLKQTVGRSLRTNPTTSDPISKRVNKIDAEAQAARKEEGVRKKAAELGHDPKDPWVMKHDDITRAWGQEEHARNNTHAKLVKRYGQKQSSDLGNDVIGDRLYRGQISGGDPWKSGTYGAAFHYGHPAKRDTRTYSGTPVGSGTVQFDRGWGGDKLHVTHHYKNHPDQLYGPQFKPEEVISAVTPASRAREASGMRNLPRGASGSRWETPIMKQHNPFLGTELGDDYGSRSYFFPAGKAAQAAQNYAREMSKTIRSKDNKIEVGKSYKPDLVIHPQKLSGAAKPQPERLKKLEKESPEKFSEFMRRRAEKYLSPRRKEDNY